MLDSTYDKRVLNSASPGQNFWKNMWSCRVKIPLSKNLKIFHLAQKIREE